MNKPKSFDLTKEYILCSAIWFKSEKSKISSIGDDIFGLTSCYNIHYGVVICGWRHANCINTYCFLTGKKTSTLTSVQGFVTSRNRFVTRKEAFHIAKECGQINYDHINDNYVGHKGVVTFEYIYSEDLWMDNFNYRDEFEKTKTEYKPEKEHIIEDIMTMNVPPSMYNKMSEYGHEIDDLDDNWCWNSTALRLLYQLDFESLVKIKNDIDSGWIEEEIRNVSRN